MISCEINPSAMHEFLFNPSEEFKKAINDVTVKIMEKASENKEGKDGGYRYIGVVGRPIKNTKDSEPCELATEFCELPTTDKVREIITLQKQLMSNYIKHGVDPNKAAQCTSYTIWAYLGGGDIALEGGDSQ